MMVEAYSPTVYKNDFKQHQARYSAANGLARSEMMRASSLNALAVTRSSSANAPMNAPSQPRSKRARRIKSLSESGALLERMVPAQRTRPYSAGDLDELRRVTISGVSKNSKGTWMFKVDVGSDEYNTYVIRRRFTDFKELYDGLQDYDASRMLPALPNHGIISMFQIFVSPEKALNQRAEQLQELLQRINAHPTLASSMEFKKFIGKNPQSLELGYVSLSCYEAPTSENQLRLSASESSYVYERRLSN
uniref:PX domain-containing protein n=1 Tax=Globisporangium ultimum (strain ATCC 200006 / CBS 805.95 / DAOM BR144) TaxID=431595 RepID=K3WZV2_GLOUD